jgi:hypothetical protein
VAAFEPTAFLVGVADDYTFEVADAAGGLADPTVFEDDGRWRTSPRRWSRPGWSRSASTATVRIMGTRFASTFVLDQSSTRTSGRLRSREPPVGADVPAAFDPSSRTA